MATLKEIEEEIETISTIKNIVEAYQEIANLRMNSIRGKVLKNRKFFIELSQVYQRTKSAYLFSLKKGTLKDQKMSFLRPKKEKVVILLSANKFFYGSLILNIWQELKRYSQSNKFDLVIVGKTGKYLVEKSGYKRGSSYFEIDDEKPEIKKTKKIIEFVKDYKEIIVFHGKYETVLNQTAVSSQISGGIPASESTIEPKIKTYLFEPSAIEILQFFEREIIAALFNQTILEHQLARYASRMIAMYQATENARDSNKNLKLVKNKLKKQITNKKQIESFSSIKL